MQGIIILTITAFIIGIIITLIDSKINTCNKDLENLLPGLNCGTCGFGSCKGMAFKIKEDFSNYKKCRPLRGEKLETFLKNAEKCIEKGEKWTKK